MKPETRRPFSLLAAPLVIGVCSTSIARSADTVSPAVLDTFLRMRIVAAVIDTHRVEGPYPGPTPGLVPVSTVVDRLSVGGSAFRGSVRDAWGNPLLYWSNGRDYVVVSYGSDGRAQFCVFRRI